MSDELQKKIFSKNLLHYISLSGKTQKEIADAIDVSPQTFNTWCQGIALPRMGKVQLLADYFHINKSDLLDDSNKQPTVIIDSDLVIIQRERNKMSDKQKTKLMNILKANFDEFNWEEDDSGNIE